MYQDVECLLRLIAEGNPFQARHIEKMKCEVLESREFEILEFLVHFFIDQGISIDDQAKSYLDLHQETMKEQLYFRRNHRYIDCESAYEDVCQALYANGKYMSSYHVGLAIAESIWIEHIKVMRWYERELKAYCTEKVNSYFEVGCGIGINLLRTIEMANAEQYRSIDLSDQTVELCGNLLAYARERGQIQGKNYSVMCGDFFDDQFLTGGKADIFTMFEVLEHVPNPDAMLERIKEVTTDDAQIFLSTPVNAPMPGHIYLFRRPQEVSDMMERHGFVIEDMIFAPANGLPLETAERREYPIRVALRMKKKRGSFESETLSSELAHSTTLTSGGGGH